MRLQMDRHIRVNYIKTVERKNTGGHVDSKAFVSNVFFKEDCSFRCFYETCKSAMYSATYLRNVVVAIRMDLYTCTGQYRPNTEQTHYTTLGHYCSRMTQTPTNTVGYNWPAYSTGTRQCCTSTFGASMPLVTGLLHLHVVCM